MPITESSMIGEIYALMARNLARVGEDQHAQLPGTMRLSLGYRGERIVLTLSALRGTIRTQDEVLVKHHCNVPGTAQRIPGNGTAKRTTLAGGHVQLVAWAWRRPDLEHGKDHDDETRRPATENPNEGSAGDREALA